MKKNLIQQINFVKQIQPGCNFFKYCLKIYSIPHALTMCVYDDIHILCINDYYINVITI